MRKIIVILMFVSSLCLKTNAQNIYNEIKNNAAKVLKDPTANDMVKQISQFKLDALEYMILKMREEMPDSSTTFLDKQAYAMNNFVNFYIQKVLENHTKPKAQQVKVIKLFMDASFSNPLFNDPDTELTLSYFANGESFTRFSLDTDWRKAVVAIVMEQEKDE